MSDALEKVVTDLEGLHNEIWEVLRASVTYNQPLHAIYESLGSILGELKEIQKLKPKEEETK